MTAATALRALLPALLAACVALSGCSAPPPSAPAPPSPSPPAPDPVAVCVRQLTYWAEVDLRGDDSEGYDYQHRGLTAQQAEALRAIVGEAQALGPDRAAAVVGDRIRAACAGIAGPG